VHKICIIVFLALSSITASELPAQTAPAAVASSGDCPVPGERPFHPGGPAAGEAGAPGSAPNRAPASGQGTLAPGGPHRKRLLIWADTRNGIAQHDIAHAEAVIEELGYKSGLYDSYIRTDSSIIAKRPKMTTGEPASGGPSLCNLDAIFFLGHREIDLDAPGRADLLWFIHDQGKGFVAVHTGVGAFMSWPEFGEMVGSRYDEHPWNTTEAPLIIVDPKFPGMDKFVSGEAFKDEFYQLKDFEADQIHVVLRLDTTHLDMKEGRVHPGDSYAQAYAKMYGKGRVFYSGLGHAPATWDDPRIQEMYLGAIKWALGLANADVTPNPDATPEVPRTAAVTVQRYPGDHKSFSDQR
jgi:type 1 glutamine amidotransferase